LPSRTSKNSISTSSSIRNVYEKKKKTEKEKEKKKKKKKKREKKIRLQSL